MAAMALEKGRSWKLEDITKATKKIKEVTMEGKFKTCIFRKEVNVILSTTDIKDIVLSEDKNFICGYDFIIPTQNVDYIVVYDAENL